MHHTPWENRIQYAARVNKVHKAGKKGDDGATSKLDQIDLMAHEAEVDWLGDQERIQRTRRKHGKHKGKGDDHDEQVEGDGTIEDERRNMNADALDSNEEQDDMNHETPEDVFHDPQWHVKHGKHSGREASRNLFNSLKTDISRNDLNPSFLPWAGGLNPIHFHPNHRPPGNHIASKNRIEKQDRDEDETVFPDLYSDQPYSKLVHPTVPDDPTSPLGYVAYNHQGDRILDFSMVGWNEGNTDIPNAEAIPVVKRLWPRQGADSELDKGDDTDRIQRAFDHVSQATENLVQSNQVVPTGSLVLERGVYRISRSLKIRRSGLLFRGDSAGGSRIVCQWKPTGPRYAIEIEGREDQMLEDTDIPVVSDYTPVGSFSLALDPTYFEETELAVGDQVVVTRVGNDRWVKDIGMDDFDSDKKGVKPWKKMRTGRSVLLTNGRALSSLTPLCLFRSGGRILAARTTDEMLDEKGRGSKDYRFSYEIFANYAFHEMLSGQSAFQLSGQLVLIKHSLSQGSFHFFVDINHVMGPSVFHRLQATNIGKPHQPMPLDFAPGRVGPHMKFCTGILVDQGVTDGSIQIVNRGDMGTGQGYAGANSVVWNSHAREGI
ncbi:MAG: hypothetical protein J3Q66DRAFT_434417 [Benniella sp.]|nr:MAG: hypothetical protein J3Q66DRAFT_434417 [Benniella sp.]